MRTRVWDANEEPRASGEEQEGRGSTKHMADVELKVFQLHVVVNSPATECYYKLSNIPWTL